MIRRATFLSAAALAVLPSSASAVDVDLRVDAVEAGRVTVGTISGDRRGALRISGGVFSLFLERHGLVRGRVNGTTFRVTSGKGRCANARGELEALFSDGRPTRLLGDLRCSARERERTAAPKVHDVRASGLVAPFRARRSIGSIRGLAKFQGRPLDGVVVTGSGFRYVDAWGTIVVSATSSRTTVRGTRAYKGIVPVGRVAYEVSDGRFTLRGKLRW